MGPENSAINVCKIWFAGSELDSGDGGSTLWQQGRSLVLARNAATDAGRHAETFPPNSGAHQGRHRKRYQPTRRQRYTAVTYAIW